MLLKVVSLSASLLLYSNAYVDSKKLDFKVLTAVRHGLQTSLEYIDRNLNDSNVDCVLGVAFVRGKFKVDNINILSFACISMSGLFEYHKKAA